MKLPLDTSRLHVELMPNGEGVCFHLYVVSNLSAPLRKTCSGLRVEIQVEPQTGGEESERRRLEVTEGSDGASGRRKDDLTQD